MTTATVRFQRHDRPDQSQRSWSKPNKDWRQSPRLLTLNSLWTTAVTGSTSSSTSSWFSGLWSMHIIINNSNNYDSIYNDNCSKVLTENFTSKEITCLHQNRSASLFILWKSSTWSVTKFTDCSPSDVSTTINWLLFANKDKKGFTNR
jgi:hypothetical protein